MQSKPKTVDLIENGSPLTLLNVGRMETERIDYKDGSVQYRLHVWQYGDDGAYRMYIPLDGWAIVHVCEPLTVPGLPICRRCGARIPDAK